MLPKIGGFMVAMKAGIIRIGRSEPIVREVPEKQLVPDTALILHIHINLP